MMLMEYFGLREDPFGNAPAPRFLYQSKIHTDALASLRYACMTNHGSCALIAPSGMGKTIVLNRFVEKFRESSPGAHLIRIDPCCGPREIIFSILDEIGVAPADTCTQMREQLESALSEATKADRKFIVVIDDAQYLSDAALEEINSLISSEPTDTTPIQIILAGKPQLVEMVMKPAFAQFRQRVATISHLGALAEREIKAYIDNRLKISGYTGDPLFTPHALAMIAEASQGVPRTINSLCFSALSLCSAMTSRQVDVNIVAEVIANLELPIRLKEDLKVAPDDRMYSGRHCSGHGSAPCETVADVASGLHSCILAEPKRMGHFQPAVKHQDGTEMNRRANSASTLGLTVIFIGFLSAFVLGAVGCLMALEHFSG
jgi:general secretion pathway protein A